jgi:formylglycine-generating enzyme required for sulfatase activity
MNSTTRIAPFNGYLSTPLPKALIAGHSMVLVPGGLSVIGSAPTFDSPPRWVSLAPFWISTTAVSEEQYRATLYRMGNKATPDDHPVNMVSYKNALAYTRLRGQGLRLLTAVEWEVAARGPAVELTGAMKRETGAYRPREVADWAAGRFENVVSGVYAHPLAPTTRSFQRLVAKDIPLWGWHVYGTSSGRLDPLEAWYDQPTTTSIKWGPANAYGIKGMTGGIREWVQDTYEEVLEPAAAASSGSGGNEYKITCGAGWNESSHTLLRTSFHDYLRSTTRSATVGLRVAASYAVG